MLYINGADIKIKATESRIKVDAVLMNGTEYIGIEPRRLMPVNAPENYIAFVNDKGMQEFLVKDINECDDESKGVVISALNQYYTTPYITEIYKIIRSAGLVTWVVDTDRGKHKFNIMHRGYNIKDIGNGRVLIRDVHDNRYEIVDYRKLPKRSQKLLAPEL